jgi:hypothetical protein
VTTGKNQAQPIILGLVSLHLFALLIATNFKTVLMVFNGGRVGMKPVCTLLLRTKFRK